MLTFPVHRWNKLFQTWLSEENFARISQRSPKSYWIYGLKITSSPTKVCNHSIKLLQPGISSEVQNVQKNDHENILTFLSCLSSYYTCIQRNAWSTTIPAQLESLVLAFRSVYRLLLSLQSENHWKTPVSLRKITLTCQVDVYWVSSCWRERGLQEQCSIHQCFRIAPHSLGSLGGFELVVKLGIIIECSVVV